jgi:hypothetical protein
MTRFSAPFLICIQLSISCSPTPSNVVCGGTTASLVAGDVPLPDFEVNIHDAGRQITGFENPSDEVALGRAIRGGMLAARHYETSHLLYADYSRQ